MAGIPAGGPGQQGHHRNRTGMRAGHRGRHCNRWLDWSRMVVSFASAFALRLFGKKWTFETEERITVSIRALPKKGLGKCSLCEAQQQLSFWDADLAGRICEDCRPFLEAAEIALKAAKRGHPNCFLVFHDPYGDTCLAEVQLFGDVRWTTAPAYQ
jgi:hypothetical protein